MRNKFHFSLIFPFYVICLLPSQVDGQNKYTVKIVQPDPVMAPVIISVTVSPENKNVVVWEQTPNENILYFKIYHDATNPEDGWINAGKTMYPGNYTFTDPFSFPSVRSYRYRISVMDKCGNEIFSTLDHKTIKLTVEETGNYVYILKWNPYEGFEVGGYKIYRGSDATNLTPIDTTAATTTTYTDYENPYQSIFYQIEAIRYGDSITYLKNTHLVSTKIRSNIASNRSIPLTSTDTTDASKIYIYPNPLTLNAVVIFPYETGQTWQLSIFDITGHPVYSKAVFSGEVEIERKNLKEGMYILQVAGKKIYRKKLMVGRV